MFSVDGGCALTSRGETQPSGLGRDRMLTAKLWLVDDRVPEQRAHEVQCCEKRMQLLGYHWSSIFELQASGC